MSDLDVGKISSQVTTNKTNIETLQNNVSTLTGSGDGSVAKTLADAKNYTDSAKAALQTSIDGKADSATSLAGYGINDAYTKTQVDTAISSAVANAHHLKREIVASLPAASQANEDTIYMVPTSGSTSDAGSVASTYTEYMLLINGGFERIGTSDVDLSNYATKKELSTAKTEAINSATTKANNALSSAKSYADGLAGNYATAAQGAKADSALQSTDIATGTSNGSISVKGTNVSVKGLGTAAYTASSAYDAAGAAANALAQAKAYAATAAQGAKADSAYSAITWGTL